MLHFLEGVKAASFLHFINRIFMKNELSPGLLSRYGKSFFFNLKLRVFITDYGLEIPTDEFPAFIRGKWHIYFPNLGNLTGGHRKREFFSIVAAKRL